MNKDTQTCRRQFSTAFLSFFNHLKLQTKNLLISCRIAIETNLPRKPFRDARLFQFLFNRKKKREQKKSSEPMRPLENNDVDMETVEEWPNYSSYLYSGLQQRHLLSFMINLHTRELLADIRQLSWYRYAVRDHCYTYGLNVRFEKSWSDGRSLCDTYLQHYKPKASGNKRNENDYHLLLHTERKRISSMYLEDAEGYKNVHDIWSSGLISNETPSEYDFQPWQSQRCNDRFFEKVHWLSFALNAAIFISQKRKVSEAAARKLSGGIRLYREEQTYWSQIKNEDLLDHASLDQIHPNFAHSSPRLS